MKKLRLKIIFIASISILIVLMTIVCGLNIINVNSMRVQSENTIDFIIERSSKDGRFNNNDFDPEIGFRSRYFIATYNEDTLINIDLSNVARISEEEAITISEKIKSKNAENGFVNDYYFSKRTYGNLTKYVFLDRQNEIDAAFTVLGASCLISLGAYIAVCVLICIFSSILLKPTIYANEKQKRFITDASHELKTPLTIINSNIEILELENGANEWTLSTKKQVERLTNMTNQLVVLSRLNEADVSINKTDISVKEFLEEIIEPYKQMLLNNGVNLSFNCEENITCKGDKKLLDQLFSSLMDNMSKYALPGEAFVNVEKVKKNIEFSFINNTDSDVSDGEIFFDRFYRADASRNSSSKSFGIGLSMAKQLVKLHDGKIKAEVKNHIFTIKISLLY